MKIATALLSTALVLAGSLTLNAADENKTTDADVIAAQLPSYPLTTCPISKEALGEMGEPINLVAEGRLIRVCCKGCVKGVMKEPAKAIAEIDAAVVKAQGPSYPLETCVISGEKLTSMGKPVDIVLGTRLVRACCKGCVKKIKGEPKAALAKVNTALIEQQRKTYPLDTCPISGEGLNDMGEPVEILHGTTLVRLCCKGCVKGFKKDPKKTIAKIYGTAKKAG